ncbi:NAD(P)H-quinone oxidoreductase [Pigmentiphaga soli]|uniref:NAD(P)H-quinone oxidoreductase n=1 Tax=Pigmentiphaga soli TaxID=1007095 RepID=A0ABP8HRI9_9BURK
MLQDTIVIARAGGPEVLTPARRPVPEPGRGQVLIRVRAAGVNRHDCGQRARGPNNHESDIPGLEVAGVVQAVGDEVVGLEPGTEVCALINGGGYAQYALAEAPLVMPMPAGFSDEEAAGVPEVAFTTWYNMFFVATLKPGGRVLIHGGTSGVGVFAIQLLTALGHPVYATCGTPEKVDLATQLGARHAFNYRSEDFAAQLKADGVAIDAVLDMSGGRYMAQNLDVLAYGGHIVHLTTGTAAATPVPLGAVMQKEARVTGSRLRPLPLARKIEVALALKSVAWPLLGNRIRPLVHRVFPLAQAADAHRYLESGDSFGKLILKP